jgi:salicylate hydroxylase
MANADPVRIVHQASLVHELLAPLPKERLHAGEGLRSLSVSEDGVELTFLDGTVEHFHAVIGADGIFGNVRRYVLEDTADACAASPGGFWDSRNLIPMERAKEVLGAGFFEGHRQYGWIGEGEMLMHDILDGGKMVQVVLTASEHATPKDRKRPLTSALLENQYSSWPEESIVRGMIEVGHCRIVIHS